MRRRRGRREAQRDALAGLAPDVELFAFERIAAPRAGQHHGGGEHAVAGAGAEPQAPQLAAILGQDERGVHDPEIRGGAEIGGAPRAPAGAPRSVHREPALPELREQKARAVLPHPERARPFRGRPLLAELRERVDLAGIAAVEGDPREQRAAPDRIAGELLGAHGCGERGRIGKPRAASLSRPPPPALERAEQRRAEVDREPVERERRRTRRAGREEIALQPGEAVVGVRDPARLGHGVGI